MRLEGCQAPAVRQRLAVRSHWQRRSHPSPERSDGWGTRPSAVVQALAVRSHWQRRSHPSPERSDGWGTRHFLFGAAGRANNH
jgi:hypothetical protein